MDCPRCKSGMIEETFEDLRDDTGTLCFYGFRCVICGEILDPVIIANRERRPHLQARNRKLMAFSRS
jgi:hypothetical protein